MEFKNFTEQIRCRVVPMTYGKLVWLDEKVVDDDEYCTVINNRHFDAGECYDDFLYLEAKNLAELSGEILQKLYARGFSTGSLQIVDAGRVVLDYSFLDDEPWFARREITVIARGDITDENDHRRDKSTKGRWFKYSELKEAVGKNMTNKIFSSLED